MFRPRINVDTSVIGGCFDEEFDVYSLQLFDEFISGKKIPIISDIVLFELEGAPENVKKILEKVPNANIEYIPLNKESNALANAYLDEGVVSENVHEILRIACTKK